MMSALRRPAKKRDQKPTSVHNDSSDEESSEASNFFSLDSNPLSNPLSATSLGVVSSLPSVGMKARPLSASVENQPLVFKDGVKTETLTSSSVGEVVEETPSTSAAFAGPAPRPSKEYSYGYPLPGPSDESSLQHDEEVLAFIEI